MAGVEGSRGKERTETETTSQKAGHTANKPRNYGLFCRPKKGSS